jgi:NADPH:quinone reductase-like Zn-dependent oxidoreductase
VLQIEDLPNQQPGAGRSPKVQAIGLNRAEVMFRTGHYLEQPEFPSRIPHPLWTAFARNFILRTYVVYNYCGLPNAGLPRNEEAFVRAVQFSQQNLTADELKSVIARTFRLTEIREAHRYMESNQQLGKIVVTV